jgi:hypothetical protein
MSRVSPWLLGVAIVWTVAPLGAWGLEGAPAGRLWCGDPASAGSFSDVYPGRCPEAFEPGILPQVAAHPLEIADRAPAFETPGVAEHTSRYQPVPPVAEPTEYYTLDELKAEMKKLAWSKGPFKVVPYGVLWFNMAWESQRTLVGDYTLLVFSPDDRPGDAFHVNARSTRLGINVSGPRVFCLGCAPSGGKVEIDFWGQFAGGENKPGVLLRHAYWEVKDESFRLLGGQTWDVISPLYPGTLLYSVGWGGGNMGYRRAQFRYERYLAFSDFFLVTAQGAVAADLLSELSPALTGDDAGWPVLEGRVAMTIGPRGKGCLPITVGVSSHFGEQEFLFAAGDPNDDITARTWSLNADVRVPITHRLGVQGEFFTGENLGAYLGGVLQGINTTTGEPIRATGGWVDLWFDWTPCLHSHVGYSIDDPIDRDVTDGRIYNDFYFANFSYNLTKDFLVGIEYTRWQTLYDQRTDGITDRVEFVAKYGF